MADQEHTTGGYLRGLITGVLIGAGAALLLAPKRGEELREELAQNATDWKNAANNGTLADRAQELKDRASELGQTVAQKAQELKHKGQDSLGKAQESAEEAADDAAETVEEVAEATADAIKETTTE